jgi:redox-sensitive bicupin YhaK (pirin superfamily)
MSTRTVLTRVKARPSHKIINRLFSPGDLGRTLKPFVFLDFLHGDVKPDGLAFGMHPHSGQQTLTYSLNAPVHYRDTEGVTGVLSPGGLEYMNPGGGAWHSSNFKGAMEGLTAFQFWFASPPGIEDGPSESVYLEPYSVPKKENFKILMGEYDGIKNPFPNPSKVSVLDVVLEKEGEVFRYLYPARHSTSFVFVYRGSALVGDDARDSTTSEIFVMDGRGDFCEVTATKGGTRFIVASAEPHEYPLSLGMYSVHTNPVSLAKGEARIEQLGEELSKAGLIS